MKFRAPKGDDAERGAALLLALGFMLMVGAISAGLLAFINTSVTDRSQLDTLRNRQYAADGGIEYAIAQVRNLASPGQDPCVAANPGYYTPPDQLNGYPIRVDCANAPGVAFVNGQFLQQRNVVFKACVQTGVACTATSTIIEAQVNYEAPSGSPVTVTGVFIQSWSVNR